MQDLAMGIDTNFLVSNNEEYNKKRNEAKEKVEIALIKKFQEVIAGDVNLPFEYDIFVRCSSRSVNFI